MAKKHILNRNSKNLREPARKIFLLRVLFTYVVFCVIGFIATSYLSSDDELRFRQLTFTVADLKEFFFTGYFLIYVIVTLSALIIIIVYIVTINRPLRLIVRAAASYADGDYETPIPYHAHNELGFITDVMNCMAQELNSLEDDQRKFVSNVSHDFRSPLTSIKGYAEAIADGTIPPEYQDKYLHVIIAETERLEKLTQSLMELNKYSAKGVLLNLTSFDLNEMIRQTLLTFEGRAIEKGLTFHPQLTDGELLVKADSAKIEQVLHNLIDNAVKFSTSGSRIDIETTIKNGKAFTSVRDYGIGIPKDSLNKIWERFYKTDLSRGKDKTGTGLGLAIVKEIIHAHHENINVISTEGVGTEFIFSLTLASPSAQ
ncbi:MAG: cell wall metabolism sensor histidine kinase WalK [Clostridiales bacterium]|nr:cell wall metabolism sensor histidine kinase WalK [Clostridiales bacterium]